jgi:proteasome lid subunit RPN8/RPN11
MQLLKTEVPVINFITVGDEFPPDSYLVEMNITCIIGVKELGIPDKANIFRFKIKLPSDYPKSPPICEVSADSEIPFHPHFYKPPLLKAFEKGKWIDYKQYTDEGLGSYLLRIAHSLQYDPTYVKETADPSAIGNQKALEWYVHAESSLSDYELSKTNHELYISMQAMNQIKNHIEWGEGTHNNQVEQGGILLGHVYKDSVKEIFFGIVEEAIAGKSAKGSGAYLEMDHTTWKEMIDYADNILDSNPQKNLQIIGWYHTHPNGLSVFMSGTDRSTQSRMFSNDWQFAVVLNPHKKVWRVFHGHDSKECKGFVFDEFINYQSIIESDKKKENRKFDSLITHFWLLLLIPLIAMGILVFTKNSENNNATQEESLVNQIVSFLTSLVNNKHEEQTDVTESINIVLNVRDLEITKTINEIKNILTNKFSARDAIKQNSKKDAISLQLNIRTLKELLEEFKQNKFFVLSEEYVNNKIKDLEKIPEKDITANITIYNSQSSFH